MGWTGSFPVPGAAATKSGPDRDAGGTIAQGETLFNEPAIQRRRPGVESPSQNRC